jgi:predicted acetyltransferase
MHINSDSKTLRVIKIDNLEDLQPLKNAYFAQATAPLDGMWHFGFVSMAKHFGLLQDGSLIGYCCVDHDEVVLEFYVTPNAGIDPSNLFNLLCNNYSNEVGTIKGAVASTAEPLYLGNCLDHLAPPKVIASTFIATKNFKSDLTMQLATIEELHGFVNFAVANTKLPADWISAYYANLIARKELWGHWNKGQLLASGECRLFDRYQCDFAELGVIVSMFERSKGLATQVLGFLTEHAKSKNLGSICSTETSNIAAYKAILKAGFCVNNKILKFQCASDTE